MGFVYEKVVRPVLFTLDSERAHEVGVNAMARLGRMGPVCRWLERRNLGGSTPVHAFGLSFPNAVGLAAGFDKNARAWPAAAAMGFGHVEIGTVTALQQPGNPKPRMFRYPSEEAVINRMGFNNEGAEQVAARLARMPRKGERRIPLGVNLGKSKVTALEDATGDYLRSFSLLAEFADYLVLNVSSPNTPDLRKLQDEDRLRELLGAMAAANRERAMQTGQARLPLLLKIAPDLSLEQVDRVIATLFEFGFDGIIATNTTLARPGYFASINETGGLSGKPVRARSTEIVRHIARVTNGKLPIVGVGGITDLDTAQEKLDAGAILVQVYSGMIYRGPFFAAKLGKGLRMKEEG